ncbi:hypothetical protein CMEL01_07999 [Colletotrichum melonis]|uniref:Armadillo-like helical domain-containing protein n=1 Tax=Colletotrichum melonis TaxID=1209925 RepID=A0AAI9TZ60_9PEZI|nr:hypothetical protein CMEL01_07999 [Colletotrichum melonis]
MPKGEPGGIPTAEGAVNGHPVNAICDTGAGCNLVSSSLARRLGFEPPCALPEEQTGLRLANGKTIMSAGAINAMWTFAHDPQRYWNISFQIISDFAHDIVLGSQFLAASGTMNEHRARLSKIPRPLWATSLLFTSNIGSVSQRLQGTIDGVAVQALPDSGSESNLVSLSFARSHRNWHRAIDWKDQRLLRFPDGKFEKTMGSAWAYWASLGQSISPSSCDGAVFQFHILESCIHDVILGQDALEELEAFTEHTASFVESDRGLEPVGFNLVTWIPTKRPKMVEVTDVNATPPSRQNQQTSNEHRNSGPQIQACEILNGLRTSRTIWLEMMAKGWMSFERKRECRRRAEVVRAIRVMAPGPERDAAVAEEEQIICPPPAASDISGSQFFVFIATDRHTPGMEASPLTRQAPPEVFKPKIVQLYESLFKVCVLFDPYTHEPRASPIAPGRALPLDDLQLPDRMADAEDDAERSEGFWREFFLLRPDRPALKRILDGLGPADMLALEEHTRELFARAVTAMKSGQGVADLHALDTLCVFLCSALSKKYAHPSSDIIIVLAGIDYVDTIFTDFVGAVDQIIRSGKSLELRQKAVEVVLAVTAGAYQTSLLTYFIQRDLFPSFIQDTDTTERILSPFSLLGLLANYNKFEFQNPYQMRLNDFVNEATIKKIIRCIGQTCESLTTQFVDVQDDLPEGWTFNGTLRMIGLGAVARGPKPEKKPVYDAETMKQMFTKLPGEEAAVLLATYDFTHANKLFCFNLATLPAEKGEEQPLAAFTSLTSYLLQHAHLSERTTHYSHLNLMVFRLLIEDPVLCKRICSEESKGQVRLCRQRQPFLPLVRGDRILATAVLDTMVDGITHNLRRRLDVGLYTLCVGILLRVISYLSRSRTRLTYHWADLFRALLNLIRFLTQYVADLKDLSQIDLLLDNVVNLVALSLSAGEGFLPSPAAYDDLFYKVVEAGDTLTKFKESYQLGKRPSNSIDTLISVSTHYKELLAEGGKKKGNLTSMQVTEVIKQGYETLSIQAKEGLDTWDRYREADERTLLKKMARAAVADVRGLVER